MHPVVGGLNSNKVNLLRVTEIREKGSTVLRVKSDVVNGSVTGLIFGDKEVDFSQGQRPQVQKIKGQNLVGGMAAALSQVKNSESGTKSFAFSVDEKLNPTLTINDNRTITWDADTKRILKDGSWSYIISGGNPMEYASIARKDGSGKDELWFIDIPKGIETTKVDGKTLVKKWFLRGPASGTVRSITQTINGKTEEIYSNSVDELGRIIRGKRPSVGDLSIVYDEKDPAKIALMNIGKIAYGYGMDGAVSNVMYENATALEFREVNQ